MRTPQKPRWAPFLVISPNPAISRFHFTSFGWAGFPGTTCGTRSPSLNPASDSHRPFPSAAPQSLLLFLWEIQRHWHALEALSGPRDPRPVLTWVSSFPASQQGSLSTGSKGSSSVGWKSIPLPRYTLWQTWSSKARFWGETPFTLTCWAAHGFCPH